MIPNEAIDAASKAIESRMGGPVRLQDLTHAALEAAAPYMQAQALRDAADAMTRETPGAGPWGIPQHEHQAQWLRELAAELRGTP